MKHLLNLWFALAFAAVMPPTLIMAQKPDKPTPISSNKAATKQQMVKEFQKWQTTVSRENFLTMDYTNKFHRKSLRKTIAAKPRVSEGKAFFAKPNKFRWDIKTHDKSLIYDGENLFQYFKKDNSATQIQGAYDLKKITDIVLSFDSLIENYNVENVNDMKNSMIVTLIPKVPTDITEATITIDKSKKYLSTIKLIYSRHSFSEITFSNPQFSKIPQTQFKLPNSVKSIKKL